MKGRKRIVIATGIASVVIVAIGFAAYWYEREQAEVVGFLLVHHSHSSAGFSWKVSPDFEEWVATASATELKETRDWIRRTWVRRERLAHDLDLIEKRLEQM